MAISGMMRMGVSWMMRSARQCRNEVRRRGTTQRLEKSDDIRLLAHRQAKRRHQFGLAEAVDAALIVMGDDGFQCRQ